MPPLKLQTQLRTYNSLISKINNTSANTTRTFCSSRVILPRAGRQSGASLVCGVNGIERIPAHITSTSLGGLGVVRRGFATATSVDDIIEELTEQYGVARDEFEIATEETDKQSIYATADRAAAVEELEKLKSMYEEALNSEYGVEIKRRVGQRVRELERGVEALEEKAREH